MRRSKAPTARMWFLILLTLFLIIAMSAATARRTARSVPPRKWRGRRRSYLVRLRAWAWNNMAFVSILGLFVVAYLVVIGYQGLMGMGVYEGYTA